MGNILTWREVLAQSNAVFNQFGYSKWLPYAKFNRTLPYKHAGEFYHSGIGKFLLCVAMGESLEDHIDTIKKYRDRIDILTCDKGFGTLLEHGVKADFVILCDCNIPYRWVEKYIDETKDVKLLSTVYANPQWTYNWKGERYFFANEDSIQTEKHFLPIFNNNLRIIPAGSNVSNAMIIFFTGCNEHTNENWAGYEKYLLVGYDYSWRPNGNYYAWNNPEPKRYYMNHRTLRDINDSLVFTSENLYFSAKWLYSYVTTFNLPIVNCSERGILNIPYQSRLIDQLKLINPDARTIYNMQIAYNAMMKASEAYLYNKKMFETIREVRYYDNRTRL